MYCFTTKFGAFFCRTMKNIWKVMNVGAIMRLRGNFSVSEHQNKSLSVCTLPNPCAFGSNCSLFSVYANWSVLIWKPWSTRSNMASRGSAPAPAVRFLLLLCSRELSGKLGLNRLLSHSITQSYQTNNEEKFLKSESYKSPSLFTNSLTSKCKHTDLSAMTERR